MGAAIARNWRGSGGALSLLVSVGMALPSFWVGATLVLLFAVNFGWLPSSGGGSARALILPAITLALQPTAVIARLTEAQLREALGVRLRPRRAGQGA